METFTIVELFGDGLSEEKETIWQKAKTENGLVIVLWGSFEEHSNIDRIRKFKPPFILKCEETFPAKKKYGDLQIQEDEIIEMEQL